MASPFDQTSAFGGSQDPAANPFLPAITTPFDSRSVVPEVAAAQSPATVTQRATSRLTLVDGTTLSSDELAQSQSGAKLLAVANRTRPYDFLDALSDGGILSWDFVPYISQFASVGGSLYDASEASNAFRKMQRGEPLSREEAIKATLFSAENEMKANGTWGSMVGGIVRQAPAFFAEFGFTGSGMQALRSAMVTRAAGETTEAAVKFLTHAGVTRATKTGATELSEMFVKSAIKADLEKGVFASASQAAKAYMESPEFIARTAKATSAGVRDIMEKSAPYVTGIKQWAPGLADKVSDALSERAVRASLAHMSQDSRWLRFFDSSRRAVRNSVIEGLTDLGEWGTESASTVMTGASRASQAFAQAGLDLTFGAGSRGLAMFLPREAVSRAFGAGMEAVTGEAPVRATTLGLEQAAWQNGDEALMSRAETYGMFLDLLEYVSESSGRGFNNLFRGAGLAAAPKLMRPAVRIAGTLETKGATQLVRDSAGKITDIVYDVGLVDAARGAEVGGAMKRYIEKVAGGRSLKENVAADRLTAVTHKLSKMGVDVPDSAALSAALESGAVRGLDPAVVRALGPDIKAFAKSAVREANHEGLRSMKLHGMLTYYVADFMARHNYDAARAFEKFTQMGYDGVIGEMMEERYSDVVSTLFGLDAEEKGFWDRVGTSVRRMFMPDGGLKQLLAEATGFAVPLVVRAGVMRTIAAMGSKNDFANHAAWASSVQDALHYGTIQNFRRGDYIARVAEQAKRLRDTAAEQRKQAGAEGVTDLQRRELTASAEGYERAAVRAENLREAFLKTVDPSAEEFAAPVYSDADLTQTDAEFNQNVVPVTAQQATSALAGYRSTLEFAGKAGQLQYKALHRTNDEASHWFRRASHWVAEHALRLGGTLATGDFAFLSANPAAFAAADRGVSQSFLDSLQKAYGNVYEAALRELSTTEREGSGGARTVDTEAAHALALERFQPQAEQMMAHHLAAMQTYMFSHDELRDIALVAEAEKDGFMVDPERRRLVAEDGSSLSYSEYLARDGVSARVDSQVEHDAGLVYNLLTNSGTTGATLSHELNGRDQNILLRRIVNIPKGLPTADQAVLATVLKYHPAFADTGVSGFRDVMVKTQLDSGMSVEDQLPGISTRKGHLKLVADVLTQGRTIQSPADFRDAVARIAEADPGIVELIGRDLGYSHSFTEASKRRRDEAVARYVLASTMFDDPDTAVFTRSANINEDEQRVGSHFTEVVPVRHTARGWEGAFRKAQDGSVETIVRPTLDELEQAVSADEYGYSRHERRVVHTAVRTLYADTAQDVISSLNLGREYRERQDRIAAENPNNELLKDPALRKAADGTYQHTMEEARSIRKREAREAAEFVAHGKQQDPALYLLPGESAKDSSAIERARARMERLRTSYNSREARQKDGRALGYNAIAEDLVNAHGVRGGTNSRFSNEFGTVDADLRNKFTVSLSALRGVTGDVYIPIDHTTAQSYSSSMLSALLMDRVAMGRRYVKRMFPSQIRDLLQTVETIVDNKIADAKDPELKDRWTAFADAFVRGSKEGYRSTTPSTLNTFIQAFCLYRTEVPNSELISALGDFGGELKEIAAEVRRSPAFVPFCMAADFLLGGSGFETSVSGNGRGLATYYAMFAPHGAPGFQERVAESRGVDYAEFAGRAREAARMAFRDAAGRPEVRRPKTPGRKKAPGAPAPATVDEAVAAAPDEAFPELEIAKAAIAEETGEDAVSMDDAIKFASMLGGDTAGQAAEQVTTDVQEETVARTEKPEEDLEELDDEGTRRGYYDVALDEPPKPFEVSEDGSRQVTVDYRDVKELAEDEAKAFAGAGRMLAEVLDPAYDLKSFREVIRKIVPGVRQKDLDQLTDAYNAEQGYYGDEEWAWSLDTDEEGITQDGFENNNARNVEIIQKSPVIRRLLAIMSKVSPATGRDFQPLIEDLRSFASIAPTMFADRIAAEKAAGRTDLKDAIAFLDTLLNPRAQAYASACVREAAFNDMLDGFAPGVTDENGRTVANPKRDVIRRHIAAFMRAEGDAPVPCARAAVLFAYFAQLRNDNARRQLAQLIGSSAPSTPVRLETRRDAEGNLAFMIRAVNQRPGTLSSEAITSQFARWVDRPASELKAAADRLEKDFKAVQERLSYRTAADGRRMAPALVRADRTGLFDTYANVLARTFGSDAPVTVAFSSMRHVLAVRNNRVGNREAFLSKFIASDNGLPYAVRDLVGMMRAVAETAGDGNVPASVLEEAAIGLFQSGAPENRHVNYAQSSLMGRGAWSLLLRGYADTKPVTVMRAEIDPTRTSKPASSLAITMAGVEPVIQQFLDRTDERGFRAVVDKWFPKYAGKPIDRLRQRLAWPDSLGTGLVAKNVVKTAFATETLAGCRAAYEAEQNGPEEERTGMVYVPMFSGDHSSSVIIQVPLAKEFAAAGMSYDQVADMVCDWFGLDLFGVDAKRSAVTCLESPGVSLVGIVRDEAGNPVLDESGNPKTGTCTYGIVWNSAKGANNEAMLGTLGMFGYGATRIRQMARDPGSATLKVHISAVGPDAAFGTMPTLTKALTVGFGPGDKEGAGQFLEGTPLRGFMDHAESGVGSDGLSTYILADYDSVKMDVLNSKMVGVDDGKGGVIPLMKYVFDTRLAALLRAGEKVDGLSGAELDEKIGDIQFVNLAKSKKPVSKKLSELVPDAKIRAVKGMEGVYTLERTANQLMAFQVANVSHKAKPETTQTARNYMMDALAAAHTIEDVLTPARSNLMPGVSRVTGSVRRLVSSWGVFAAAIGHDERSIDNMLAQDEEWLDAQHRGEPVGGPVYQQYRRKAYAAWVKSQLRTLPMKNIYSPLVSNCAWVDQTDGTGAVHPSSQMFRDTLQGARTIARGEREFWGAEKRVAICNVNNSDASFRYGMYIDSEKLMSHRDLAAYVSATPGEKGVVETLEAVITEIVKGGDTEVPLRLALAECLLDHHGKALASRRYEQRLRDRKTGEVQTRLRQPALEISYLDLFTSIHSTDGTSSFDRAAVYTGMHDSEGNVRLYLGGTMFGLPRTPSYNGSMWLQVVRAGLPVTERLRDVQDEEGNVSGQWLAGTNAMVAPDPFTLKILGCDHDGDKANLYMLDPQGAGRLFRPDAKASREARRAREEGREEPEVPQRSFRFEEADLADLFREADAIATAVAENPDADVEALLAQYRQRLIDTGILQYEMKTERLPDGSVQRIEGRLQFAPQAAARLNNTWVQALFDMNRALPVPSRKANVPFYAGTVVTEGNRGLMSRGTKATPSSVLHKEGEPLEAIPETATETVDAWDASVTKAEGTLAPKVLDATTGRTIKNVKTAAKVQTGAAFVSEARGRFVKAAGDMHLLYALGVRMGVTGGMSGQDFVDHMYHQDGPNNMSFDDMKEQICSRLGLLPGMVETFLYEYGIANGASLTDAQANVNMARFARRVNDPQDLYHYLLRASDPSDTEFVDQTRGLGPATPEVDAFVNWMPSATESERIAVESAMNGDHGAGVMAFIAAQKPEGYEKAKDAIVAWWNGVKQISDASYFATAVNYTKADPGDPYAGGTASRQAQTFFDTVKPASGRRGVQVDRQVELNRMFAASQLLLGGPGSVVAARGVKSVSEYRTNVRDVLDRLGSDPAKAVPTHELSLVVAAQNSPRLRRRDRLQAAGNAYMVGAAAAQFLNTKQIPGSPLNGDFYRKCAAVAEAVASVRHPAEEGRELSGGYANATLDFRYAVESMADLFSRLLASSTVGRQLPVFNYLVEYPDAGRHAYDAAIFGPAASGVARVTLGLGDVTAAQLQRVQGYWSRIVDGRELDTDGVLGRLPYTQTTNRSSFTPEFQKRTISFEFSVANLETLAKYLRTQQGKAAFQQEFDSASQSVRETAQRSRAEGRSRNTLEDVQMLISVFKRLEQDKAMFPNGVHIQPSALFGQLLPAYAAITDFSEEAPGPGSHSLLALVPDGYRTQAEELKRILDNRATARALAIAEAINWAPVQAYAQQEYEDDARSLDKAAMPSRTEQARSVSAALRERAAVRRKTAKNGDEYNAVVLWTADHDVRPLFVSGHRTLGIFDGTRGVAFSALLNCIKYGPAAELKLGTAKRAEASRPQQGERPARPQQVERPARPQQVERPARPVRSQTGASDDRMLVGVARSLQTMFQAWNGTKVEYDPKNPAKFTILSNLQVKGQDPDARLFKTKIDVYLTKAGELADTDVDKRLADANYMKSALARAGMTQERFDAMSLDEKRAFVRRSRATGVTQFRFDDAPGAFRVTMGDLETLTAKVTLDTGARPVTSGTAFHEAFHAVMGFVRATGVLSSEDIAVLQKKYGKATVGGQEWFNEEPAAMDYQKLVSAELAPSPETKTPQGIWAKLKAFFTTLLDAIRGAFGEGHRAEDYGNEMRENPLMQIMLTGVAEASRDAEGTRRTTTDVRGAIRQAVENAMQTDDPDSLPEGLFEYLGSVYERLAYYPADVQKDPAGFVAREVADGKVLTSGGLQELLDKFGPRVAGTGRPVQADVPSGETVDVTPNPVVESTVAEILPAPDAGSDIPMDLTGVESVTEDQFNEAQYDVQPVLPRVRQALAGVDSNRMAVPYSDHELLAASLGAAIRDGFTEEALGNIDRLTLEQESRYTQDQVARMRMAIGRIADLYGVTVPAEREAVLFKGLCQLGVNIANAYQCAAAPEVNLHLKPGKPRSEPTRSRVSSAQLAAAVATASGVLPSDMVEAALYDVRQIADRRGRGNAFTDNVLDGKLIPMLEDLMRESADPVGLLERFNEAADAPNELMSSLLSGLVAEKDADGYRTGFRLADVNSSDNPDFEANRSLYADHIDDPDFQKAVGTVADTLYMLAASRNMYRDLGFTPGRPTDAAAFPAYDGTAKSPMEMAVDLGSMPEQYVDPAHESVSFFDQAWFVAESPKMWLDSMLAESFGKVGLRESMQGLHAEIAGYQNRIVALRNLHAYEYGLSDLAGVNLLEVDEGYDSGFEWKDGRIVHGEREALKNIRRYKNGTKTRTKVSLTLNEQRTIDMVLKARRVWLAGGRKVITGVDGLTFSLDDSADPAYYSRENVAKRVGMGYGRGESDIDKALYRLDLQLRDDPRNGNFDWIVESGDGRYGLRDRLVNGICTALGTAGELVRNGALERGDVNDFVIQQLDREGLVNGVQAYRRNVQGARFVSAAVTLDADEIEDLFLKSSAYAKLVQAGRKPAWLTREAYAQPYRDLWREVKSFVASRPFLSEGDGRFFHNVNSPVPFVRGSGVFMHEAARVERQAGAETANQVRTKYAATFENLLADPEAASTPAGTADADTLLMMRTMFHLPEQDVESIRRAIVSGDYADVRGLNITAASTVADIADAIYQRLVGMVWNRSDATGEAAQFGGLRAVTDLLEKYRERRLEDGSVLSGGSAGMSDEMVHRMTGVLPASHQLGHALQNAIDGILNAYAYRAAVINMATAPAEDGTPLCYVKPSLDAAETSGVPDDIWGSIARWQAAVHHLEYDPKRSGVENARNIYDRIVGSKEFDKSLYGSINPEEMDTRAIEGFWARKGVPEGESSLGELAGGYALGYAKHLFQATKALGGKYQRAIVHRAWAYSKAMSVSFSLFFPIATRFESPIGAVGALATLGGNISSDALRRHAAELQKIWGALRGKGWITKDFIGETDFVKLLDSNDPFLSEMYRYASAIGLTLSNTNANVIEQSRGILMQDLKNLTNYVHDKFGAKAAKRVDAISKAVFVRGSEKAFAYHLNATKLAVAAQMCMKLQAEAASRGIMFDPVRDLRRYSSYINAEVGGIDPMSYAWAHPKMQNLMNTLFFSWNWTRGAWEAGGGKVIEKLLFGGHDVTPEETRFLVGRAVRMWGWIAFGLPTLAQILAKALGMAIDPDHEDRDDEKWFIWENEDKAAWKSCDLTPLMRAIGKRFPWYAKFRKEHPFLSAAPTLAFMVSRNPWITGTMVAGALPVSKEPDKPQRHMYFHLGKQAWEFYNWFDDPVRSFFSKLSMPIQRVSEGILGRSLTSLDYKQPWADMGAVERWVVPTKNSALFNLGKAFIPFSLSGMTDMGTDGLLPILGPTSHGASKYAITKELEKALDAWSSNDRRGYAFGGPLRRFATSKAGRRLMQRNVNVRSLVATAVANGHVDEKTAYELVDAAANTIATKERRRLIEMVPDTPDGDYDVKAWSASVRKLQRLGVLGKNLRDSLVKRLKEQKRWQELTADQRREMLRILGAVQRDPYGVKPMDY